ncbi:MAG TPA: cation:proton antiporter, partial [Jatrophihabitans sp.]
GTSPAEVAEEPDQAPELALLAQLGRLNSLVLLPIFFASSGLAPTPLGSPVPLLILTVAFSALALGGRVLGTMPLARWTAVSRSELTTVCCLICARGATEIVMLRVGQRLGLVPDALYSPMVLTALATTLISSVGLSALKPGGWVRPAGTGWQGRLVDSWLELMGATTKPWFNDKGEVVPAVGR